MTDERRSAADGQRAEDEAPAEPERVLLHMPVDVRSVALAVLAVLVSVYVLHWARDVFIPLMLGVLFSYALTPLVDWMQRWRVPRWLGAAIVLCAVLGGVGSTIYSLADDAAQMIESLPGAVHKLHRAIRAQLGTRDGPIERVQQAAAQIEQAAKESSQAASAAARGVTRVQIERPKFNVTDYLWTGTIGLVGLVVQITVVCFLTYFLMVSGDIFRRKLVKIAGPTFSEKKITVQVLDEITDQVQRYLLVQVVISIMVGIVTWLAFLWIGVDHAAVWGVVSGVLNMIPYIGAIAVTAGVMLVGFLQFGTLEMAMLIGAVSLVIHTVEGYLLAPWLTSRAGRMNAVVVFAGVLVWGWLWGAWGLVLGIPILMIVKSVCDHVEDLKPVGELLGD